MATLKDIANLAGVSQGTVSNVLNGRGNVSSKKIKLVEAAATQLGYTANEGAKMLRKGSSNILALVLPDTRERSYNDIYVSFKSCAEKAGYSVSLYMTDNIPSRELRLINKLRSDMVAGVAVVTCLDEPENPYSTVGFSDSELLFLERKPAFSVNYLGFNYYQAGYELGKISNTQSEAPTLLTDNPCFFDGSEFINGFMQALSTQTSNAVRHFKINRKQKEKEILRHLNSETHQGHLITSSFSLAETAFSIQNGFFPHHEKAKIYTVSPLFTLPDCLYQKYELDYRALGNRAAGQLIAQIKDQLQEVQSVTLPNIGFRKWSPAVLDNAAKELNLLMLNGPEAAATQYLSRLYTEQTGTRIRISVYSYDEIFEILSSTGGESFDILRIDITFLSWFAQELLVPLKQLDPFIDTFLQKFLDGVAQRYSTVSGTIYAIPFSPSVQLLYYRKDLFESTVLRRLYQEQYKSELIPPKTFTELNQIANFFTNKYNANSPVEFGSSLTLGSIGVAGSEFMARFLEKQENLYDSNGRVCLNSNIGLASLQELVALKDFTPNHTSAWWTDTANDFASGKLAMAILYSNYSSDLLRSNLDLSEINCSLVPGRNPVLGGASLGISKFSKKQKDALNYIKWLCSDTISSASILLGGASPCKAAYDNVELTDMFPWLELAGKSFSIANGLRQPPKDPTPFNERQFLNIIGMAVKNAYNGVQTPENALDWAQREFDRSFRT